MEDANLGEWDHWVPLVESSSNPPAASGQENARISVHRVVPSQHDRAGKCDDGQGYPEPADAAPPRRRADGVERGHGDVEAGKGGDTFREARARMDVGIPEKRVESVRGEGHCLEPSKQLNVVVMQTGHTRVIDRPSRWNEDGGE